MTPPAPAVRRIVVGFDGSPSALRAADWAARRAGSSVPVTLLHVRHAGESGTPAPQEEAALRNVADRLRERGAQVQVRVDGGSPAQVLVEATAPDTIVVIGTRGHSGIPGLLAGSVAGAVAGAGDGPVVVVSNSPVPNGPVTAALGDEPVQAVLVRAAAEARAAGVPLRIVHAWEIDPVRGVLPLDHERDQRLRRVRDVIGGTDGSLRGLDLSVHVAQGDPRHVLLGEASASGLLVMGSRGRGALAGALLGSVSRTVAATAACPVMVVRG